MSASKAATRFTARQLQLARAALAALAALMVTFSQDHSAEVGLAVFSGFALATGLAFALAAWLVAPAGARGVPILMAVFSMIAGVVAGVPPLRSTALLFAVVITWAALTGITELSAGIAARRAGRPGARDAILIGALTLLFAVAVALIPPGYALDYFIAEAGQGFTLTGTIIAVGILGGYAAIVAVYLGIAGFSPQREPQGATEAAADRQETA